ncbi:hypothetical protein ARTHRO9V_220050 [Arthrobacter sp. 9V]|nr:hypothetical protein ARTHRO9V_220050 [Arthrobacter sp. 9V]
MNGSASESDRGAAELARDPEPVMGQGLDSGPEWGSAEKVWWDPGAAAQVRDPGETARARGWEEVSRSLLCVLRV